MCLLLFLRHGVLEGRAVYSHAVSHNYPTLSLFLILLRPIRLHLHSDELPSIASIANRPTNQPNTNYNHNNVWRATRQRCCQLWWPPQSTFNTLHQTPRCSTASTLTVSLTELRIHARFRKPPPAEALRRGQRRPPTEHDRAGSQGRHVPQPLPQVSVMPNCPVFEPPSNTW